MYAFDGDTYTGFNTVTDAAGEATFTLPQGDYRFRADKDGTQFWSSAQNACTLPGCTSAEIRVSNPLLITVLDTDGAPQEGLPVYVFDGETYTGFNGQTDAQGQVALTLPFGSYRFRADLNGTQFWSGAENHCTIPECASAAVTVTIPVVVSVIGLGDVPFTGLPVYAFDGDTYTGYSRTSDEHGQAAFTLPTGDYRFRADISDTQFWSAEENDCAIPGCLAATISIPYGDVSEPINRTIDYGYDGLNRLAAADYDDGSFFHYAYDEVGNRLNETTNIASTDYVYDAANRLTQVGAVPYTWDANGNLLSDGLHAYTYDPANRLVELSQAGVSYSYLYNGLGGRLQQSIDGLVTNYTLDLNAGLTQVLTDGAASYLYGLGRIGEQSEDWHYHLPDALGSVRQLADAAGAINYVQDFTPYGKVANGVGQIASSYGFAGEWTDLTGMQYLRTRYYLPELGRFISADAWEGEQISPMSYNSWLYAYSNPLRFIDPSGMCPDEDGDGSCDPGWQCSSLPPQARQECLEWACDEALGFELLEEPFNLSAYYVTHESQYYSGSGSKATINIGSESITANKYFLFSDEGVCMQGTGKLVDGNYIGCNTALNWSEPETPPNFRHTYMMPPKKERGNIPFYRASALLPPKFEAFETVAVCNEGLIPRDVNRKVEIRITTRDGSFEDLMEMNGADNRFYPTDVGGWLCPTTIDIFLGEQPPYSSSVEYEFFDSVVSPIFAINSATVEVRYLK